MREGDGRLVFGCALRVQATGSPLCIAHVSHLVLRFTPRCLYDFKRLCHARGTCVGPGHGSLSLLRRKQESATGSLSLPTRGWVERLANMGVDRPVQR